MILDFENMDVMIESGHYEREDSEFGNFVRRPESPSYDALSDHNFNSQLISNENEIGGFAGNGQNTTELDSCSKLNRLSGELNQRIKQEMNGLMKSVSLQIQRAKNEAIYEQVLPQL